MSRTKYVSDRSRMFSSWLQAGTLAVLVLAAAVGAHSSAAGNADPLGGACGSSGQAPSTQDLRYAREYRRLLTARAATVWPGWGRVPPLLQRKGRCEYLIGHPRPPRGFARMKGIDVLGSPVYIASTGTSTPGPVASTWKVGSVWAAMVPTRDEFQRALDRALGPGAVRLSDTTYLRSLVHEAFHAHQLTVTHVTPPSFDSTLDESQAVDLLSPVSDVDSLFAQEGHALADALGASTIGAARSAATRFLALRAQRRDATSDPAALGAFERQIEWMEGTARYADLRLILLAGTRAYAPTKGVRYTPAGEYRRTFLDGLADRARRPDGFRGRWQGLGAAEGLLLDRLAVGWREEALPGRRSLEDLLREAVEVPAELAGFRVAHIGVDRTDLAVALAERPAQWSQGLTGVSDVSPLAGMLFAFGKDVTAGFSMRGALIPLDIAFFDANGRLLDTVKMPLCASDPCPAYRSSLPYRFALEAPTRTLAGLRGGSSLTVPAGI